MSDPKIRVLIIDDSAFARKVVREVLERDPLIDVIGYARDGLEALEKIEELKPDVITLDLVMPDLDGFGVLKMLTHHNSPKAVIVSVSSSDSELALEALHMGAIDIVTKPTALPTDRLYDLADELIAKVRAAFIARVHIHSENVAITEKITLAPQYAGNLKLIVLGTSTGGPQAITELFKTLPANLPVPLVIALHIPEGYTALLAARISSKSDLKLVEAYDGMELVANQAVIAPGGMHLTIQNMNGRLFARVGIEPRDTLYHPSINLLFESAAKEVGGAVLGVIMTGMGNDGMIGSQAIREAGGRVLAESASSCIVYGMPRSVIEAGAVNEQAPLEKMTALMVKNLN